MNHTLELVLWSLYGFAFVCLACPLAVFVVNWVMRRFNASADREADREVEVRIFLENDTISGFTTLRSNINLTPEGMLRIKSDDGYTTEVDPIHVIIRSCKKEEKGEE